MKTTNKFLNIFKKRVPDIFGGGQFHFQTVLSVFLLFTMIISAVPEYAESSPYDGMLVPTRPAEAFNLEAIKAATFSDLSWVKSSDISSDGVRILDGTWSPGTYNSVNSQGVVQTITLNSRAMFYFPLDVAANELVPLLVYAAHTASTMGTANLYKEIAKAGVAVVVHGQAANDWEELGFIGRGYLTNEGMADLMARNCDGCGLSDLLTSNFGFVLARTNMLAISLAQQFMEYNGYLLGEVSTFGVSKEGYANWIIAAVDDRINYSSPGGFHRQDGGDALSFYEYNSGCGPNGASNVVDMPLMLQMRDWLLNSVEGQSAADALIVSRFIADLIPNYFLIHGDVGMPGMHDGIYFTMGMETNFLSILKLQKNVVYDRQYDISKTRSERDTRRLIPLATMHIGSPFNLFNTRWEQVVQATIEEDEIGNMFRVETEIKGNYSGLKGVYTRWNQSLNREFNDSGQEVWKEEAMIHIGMNGDNRIYQSPWISYTPGFQIAWYAEVQEDINLQAYVPGASITRRDASPIEFIQELPYEGCSQ